MRLGIPFQVTVAFAPGSALPVEALIVSVPVKVLE
jgi:hypothetical protein